MPKIAEFYPSRASGSNDRVWRLGRTTKFNIKDGAQRHHNFRHFSSFLSAIPFGGLGTLGTSNFTAALKLFISVFEDELLILRQLLISFTYFNSVCRQKALNFSYRIGSIMNHRSD